MEIKEFLTKINFTKEPNRKIKYIVVHGTGNLNDTALSNCKYFETMDRGSSAHYFVDEKNIYQCVKDEDVAWSVGRLYNEKKAQYWEKCTNFNSINIEMCNSLVRNEKVEKNTLWLIRKLMAKYGIPKERVIRHFDVCGKDCPVSLISDTPWNAFKSNLSQSYGSEYELVSESIETLNKVGIIKDMDYWLDMSQNVNYLDILLIRMSDYCKNKNINI